MTGVIFILRTVVVEKGRVESLGRERLKMAVIGELTTPFELGQPGVTRSSADPNHLENPREKGWIAQMHHIVARGWIADRKLE